MNKPHVTHLVLAALLALLLAGVTLAVHAANASTSIPWKVFSGGGAPATSASYGLNASLGQTAIGFANAPSHSISSGYWYSGGAVQADLTISKSGSPNPVMAGGDLAYSLQVVNLGPAAASAVVLQDQLPTGVHFVSASHAGCAHNSGLVTCNLGGLPVGGNLSVQIQVTVDMEAPDLLTNHASVKAAQLDPNPGSNQVKFDTAVDHDQLIYQHDFETPVGDEWDCTTIQQDTTPSGRGFLGQFGNQTVCLTLDGLPAHNTLQVVFDLYIIRSWNGNQATTGDNNYPVGPDFWQLQADGSGQSPPLTLLHTTFANYLNHPQAFPGWYPVAYPRLSGAAEVNTLGYIWVNQKMDSVYRLAFIFPHQGETMRLDFSAMGLQALSDESWGLDNISVQALSQFKVYLPLAIK